MRNLYQYFKKKSKKSPRFLGDFWDVKEVSDDGFLYAEGKNGFVFRGEGIDGSFLNPDELVSLHKDWRSVFRFSQDEELQIIFRKRVEFAHWIEDQLSQSFLAENSYGRQILLDRLADQVSQMSEEEPQLLSQKIIICFWTKESLDKESIEEKRALVRSQLVSFGFRVESLDKSEIEKEIYLSSQDLNSSEQQVPEWPSLKIEAGHLQINNDIFRALELKKLPESFTEFGMIQAITKLPYPMDLCLRLKARDIRPIISRLGRKRNLLNAKRENKNSPSPDLESQMDQIDQVLRSLADNSESIYDLKMTVGLRFPKDLDLFQRKAMVTILRSASQMDFCDFEEVTLGTFDSYLECIPGFKGKNIQSHTVLGSNAIHFLPFFRPSKGDRKAVVSFQTRSSSLYGIDPTDSRLANYNWLVSGTSGSGKSFFINSLLAQSASIDPNIFIVDIGGSYNKLIQFLGGRVMSLEPGQGFELSPFFLPKSDDSKEEKMRQQHIFQIFLEMTRLEGQLPSIEIRHLLSENLDELLKKDQLPDRPISYLINTISKNKSSEAQRLVMLLEPWGGNSFFGQFLDNNKVATTKERIFTFDLKGLTDFEELSRVVQLIVCASLWARIRQTGNQRFSWIVLDEVAFSLLKTQPQFVDELVSTLRKYFAGAVIVVQDFEKVTSSLASSSILQNTQSKAILQQRGNPKNYSEALSLNQIDLWAIESLSRKKGSYSDIFLIRDNEKTVIRHIPSDLEYWLATTAPEDTQALRKWVSHSKGSFQNKVIDFVKKQVNMVVIILILAIQLHVHAQIPMPISSESIQLQQLINKSEEQIKSLKEILNYSKRDAASLDKASRILEDLSSGLKDSIGKYQGTEVYEKALLELQSKDNYEKTYSDSKQVRDQALNQIQKELSQSSISNKNYEELIEFQKESVKANKSDLSDQEKLQKALNSAQPGFIPKIQVQAQLGIWQANTRVSAQMTELLSAIHAMREELRILRLKQQNSGGLDALVKGSEIQNQKQREEGRL